MLTGATVSEKKTSRGSESSARPASLQTLKEVEREIIEGRLELFNGNKAAVARSMGIAIKTLYNRINSYRTTDTKGAQ